MLVKAIVAACCCTTAVADWGMHSVPILAATGMRGDRLQDDAFGSLRQFELKAAPAPNSEKQARAGQTFLATGVRSHTDSDADQ